MILPGFINPWKGHDLIIRALPSVHRKVPNATLLIVGKAHDQGYTAQLRNLVGELKLEQQVTIIDSYVTERQLFRHMQDADIAVLPYRRITMSGILCHVVSWNLPAVMADIPVLKEFTHGKAVYFRKDEEQDLSRKIISLLTDTARKSRMRQDFAQLSKQMSWRSVSAATFKAYESIHKV
jgi:glycosyltransferase involved in cell wall biosynthesis